MGFHASSSFGLLRGLTWSLPPHDPYRLGLHSSPSSCPSTALPQICPPSWRELISPRLTQSTLGLQLTFFLHIVIYSLGLHSSTSSQPTPACSPLGLQLNTPSPSTIATWSPLVPLKLPHNKLCRKISSFLASVPSSMAQLNRPLVSNSFIFAALSSITLVSTRHPQAEPRLLAHRLVPNLSPSFRHCHRTGLQRPLLLLVSYVV